MNQLAIFIEGEKLDNLGEILLSFIIRNKINCVDVAEITFSEKSTEHKPFPNFNSYLFRAGSRIAIHIDYNVKRPPVFDGIIKHEEIHFDSQNNTYLKLFCKSSKPAIKVSNINSILKTDTPSKLQLTYGRNIMSFSLAIPKEPSSKTVDWLQGYLICQGTTDAKINSLIKLNGLGTRMLSYAYISGIEHQIENGGWVIRLEIGKPHNARLNE